MTPFEYINSINEGKDIMKNSIDEHEYNPYLTNFAMSLYPDTIFDANDMNCMWWLSKRMQYQFYLNSVEPRKRWSKWPKSDKITRDNIHLIRDLYKYNVKKAKEALSVLTDEQINWLKKQQKEKGEYKNE